MLDGEKNQDQQKPGAAEAGSSRQNHLTRVPIKLGKKTQYVPVHKIESFNSSGNYVEVSHQGRSDLIRLGLGVLEAQLSPRKFLRISRTAIVNLDHVRELHTSGKRNMVLHLESGKVLKLTRNADRFEATIPYS